MSAVDNLVSTVKSLGNRKATVGSIRVVDPNRLNWLYITYNTVEELVRVDRDGHVKPAAMTGFRWIDDHTLEIDVREGEMFPDGERLTASTIKRSFDEMLRWTSPHPPGTQFNLDLQTRCEIVGDYQVRIVLPEPDGLALGKLRAMHIMSTRFWDEVGFGYKRNGTGEGRW